MKRNKIGKLPLVIYCNNGNIFKSTETKCKHFSLNLVRAALLQKSLVGWGAGSFLAMTLMVHVCM